MTTKPARSKCSTRRFATISAMISDHDAAPLCRIKSVDHDRVCLAYISCGDVIGSDP